MDAELEAEIVALIDDKLMGALEIFVPRFAEAVAERLMTTGG